MTIFEEKGHRATKMSITFPVGTGVWNIILSFFLKIPHTG